MTALQEQAVRIIRDLSDDNTRFPIEVIKRLTATKTHAKEQTDVRDAYGRSGG